LANIDVDLYDAIASALNKVGELIRAVQRSLLKTIASTASRPPSAAAKRS
jgi:negative regulator of replication initiation